MIVVDSSVVLKWYIPEAKNEKARQYLASHVEGKDVLSAPSLLFFEVNNVLATKSAITASEGLKIMKSLHDLDLKIVNFSFDEFKNTLNLAKKFNISAYDSSYVSLAEKFRCRFVTADKKLYNKLRSHFTKIKLLN